MPRKANWKRMPTRAIRVPSADAELLLSISTAIDRARDASEAVSGAIAIIQHHFESETNCTIPCRIPQRAFSDRYYQRYLEFKSVPYGRRSSDFVQLAALIKRLAELLTLEMFEVAIGNYFATPQKSYTLADLAVNFDTFKDTAIDRYTKPVEDKPNVKPSVSSSRLAETFSRWGVEDAQDRTDNNQVAPQLLASGSRR